MSCPIGDIRRKSYTRRSRSGKRTYVPSTCIPKRGLPGKPRRILPHPTPGVLRPFGYYDIKRLSFAERKRILKRAIKVLGFVDVIRHLTLVANFNRYTTPSIHAKMTKDHEWVSKMYKKYKRSHSRSKSRSRSRSMGSRSRRRSHHRRHRRSHSRSRSMGSRSHRRSHSRSHHRR